MNRFDHDHENDRFSRPLSAYRSAPTAGGTGSILPIYSKPAPTSKTNIARKKTTLTLPAKPKVKSLVSLHNIGNSPNKLEDFFYETNQI